MELFDGVNNKYLVALVDVAIVSTVSAPVACPFSVVHVTVAHVIRPVPVMPFPRTRLGIDG